MSLIASSAVWDVLTQITCERHFCVAYSGGVDSHVLLHLLADISKHHPIHLRSIHINHGLSVHALQWQQHCQKTCADLSIDFTAYSVSVKPTAGESLEALARDQRYQQLKEALHVDECLLTAHSVDDQVETFFLQLMRGAGVKGLAAMPFYSQKKGLHLARPLLDISRESIEVYAKHHQLQWIEDDSNLDQRFDRNYWRHQVMPLIKSRWPQVLTTASRSASHCAQASDLLESVAEVDWQSSRLAGGQPDCLSLDALQGLTLARQRNLLRFWIDQASFILPSSAQIEQILQDVLQSQAAASPLFEWQGQCLRRYQNNLYLAKKNSRFDVNQTYQWNPSDVLFLPDLARTLIACQKKGQGLCLPAEQSMLEVRFRQGGERMRPAGRAHSQTLKNLFQQWHVPPWQRDRIPLLYFEDELVAIVGYGIKEGFQATFDQQGWVIK